MLRDDDAQVTPLMAVVMALLAGILVFAARLGVQAGDHARAEAAAEAAALAAVVGDTADAGRIAAANGAVLIALEAGPPVVATVRIGDVEATAAADVLVPPDS
ncbi:MAG: hypothetical protein RIE08_09695 [Acidimicrobiales bacterium]